MSRKINGKVDYQKLGLMTAAHKWKEMTYNDIMIWTQIIQDMGKKGSK